MVGQPVFLIAAEAKDTYCLEPLLPELKRQHSVVRSFNFFDDIDFCGGMALREFATADFPIAIISSTPMIEFLSSVRSRGSFLCVGLEHGIAPFKSYTYDRDLLASDYYLAPTRGWAERLMKLYPDARSKIRVGGYPRIDVIKESLAADNSLLRLAIKTINRIVRKDHGKMLVVLSWGVDLSALNRLPDLDHIDYLLHPADAKLHPRATLSRARVHVSNADVTYGLVANADLVVGDFSSLTLECICLGKQVVFMVDRTLYENGCDVDQDFFDRESPNGGVIPETSHRIDLTQAITADEFASIVAAHGANTHAFIANATKAEFVDIFLPSCEIDNRVACANEIAKLVRAESAQTPADAQVKEKALRAVDTMCFVSASYQTILGRRVDHSGLHHYFRRVSDFDGDELEAALSVWREIVGSNEARRRRLDRNVGFPRLRLQ